MWPPCAAPRQPDEPNVLGCKQLVASIRDGRGRVGPRYHHGIARSRPRNDARGSGASPLAAVVSACGGGSRGSGFGSTSGGSDSSVSNSDDASTSVGGFSSSGFSGSFADGSAAPGAAVSEGGSPLRDCDPSCTTAGGSCKSGLCSIVDNGAGLTPRRRRSWNAGGSPDTTFQWLYPYDRTVFAHAARIADAFAGAADAMSVRITATSLDYTGYFQNRGRRRLQPMPVCGTCVHRALAERGKRSLPPCWGPKS